MNRNSEAHRSLRSIALFREAMAKARNQRFEVKAFPEATHDMHGI